MNILFKNTRVVLPGQIARRDVRVKAGIIDEIAEHIAPCCGEQTLELSGAYLMAGFIDTHTHGAVGGVYFEPEGDLNVITTYEASRGVTAVTPTISSHAEETFVSSAANILTHMERGTVGARLIGIHAEGPFLNMKRKGGMRPEFILKPDVPAFERLCSACRGQLKLITLAPELEGAQELIRAARNAGVAVSAGHTDASYDEMRRAIDAGVTRMTHTFNAARPINHRDPGVLGAALCDDRVTCEVICDFTHLHPAAVEMIYKLKGCGRFTAISDSEFCAGLPDGRTEFEGRQYDVYDGVAHLPDGTICGSAGDLGMAVKNLHSIGIPLWEISEMVSANAAKMLGVYDRLGSIAVGKTADFAVLDDALEVVRTFVGGTCVFEAKK